MGYPKQVFQTDIEHVTVSTVELTDGYYDTCIFSDQELTGVDLNRSYRTGTFDSAYDEHHAQVERVQGILYGG